jgi:hypothetical protein
MISATPLFRLPATVLAAAFGAMLACQGADAAESAATVPAVERIHVHDARTGRPALSDPSSAKIDRHGLLRNGLVADLGTYG